MNVREKPGAATAAIPRGGEMKTMRKNFALVMVALLSLTIALAVAGCGKKAEETSTTSTETTTPAMSDTSSMMHDSTMADTGSHK